MLMGTMARPVGLGLILGLISARVLTGAVHSFMFQVNPGDPMVYLLMALGLAGVAALATLLPARRAARIDPVKVLKAE
jgi:ABC-type antimicrobial peptide transport system permease subunit